MVLQHRPLLAGNWKMNGLKTSLRQIYDIAGGLDAMPEGPEILICPPATLLCAAASACLGSPLRIGAQDCSLEDAGAFTGDISASMVADTGASYVILGHSERRIGRGETDEAIRRKIEQAGKARLRAIVCIGETADDYRAGATLSTIETQLEQSLPEVIGDGLLDIAYEPVWSIGAGLTPSIEEIAAVHGFIGHWFSANRRAAAGARILYGGSVKPENAAMLLSIPRVDGLLVGGASLNSGDLLRIAGCFVKGNASARFPLQPADRLRPSGRD